MARSKSMNTAEGMAHEYMVSWFRGCSFSATKYEKQTIANIFEGAYTAGYLAFAPPQKEPSECSTEFARKCYRNSIALSSGRSLGRITKREFETLDGFIQACYKSGQTRAYIERLEALCGKGVDQ